MARTPLYSPSPRRRPLAGLTDLADEVGAQAAAPLTRMGRFRASARHVVRRHERWLWAGALVLATTVAGWPAWTLRLQAPLTIKQIDAELRDSIAKEALPSAAAAAYEAILPAVVRVVGEHDAAPETTAKRGDKPGKAGANPGDKTRAKAGNSAKPDPHADPDGGPHGENDGRSVGTGVVIVDKGLIVTNLHVIAGAKKITVTFWDGSESEAIVVSSQPENDLAVLQAKTIPDDLHAATLRSTSGLTPGDEVLAVGFPFGIGPSASRGVVSGLKREFRSPEGQRILTNLIQFDAAANPGNSGGPLVTMDGHLIGIVTAIMNPNQQRTFIGIGFAVPIENAAAAVGMSPF